MLHHIIQCHTTIMHMLGHPPPHTRVGTMREIRARQRTARREQKAEAKFARLVLRARQHRNSTYC